MLKEYLEKLGFSDKEQALTLVLARLGVQPASSVARFAGLDRVTAYKHLKRLADRGLVKIYVRDSFQCFGIESFDALETMLKEKIAEDEKLLHRFPTVENILKSLRESDANVLPRLQIFEGESGVKAFFRDMLSEVKREKVRQIRVLSSNTFDEQMTEKKLEGIIGDFFNDISKLNVQVEAFEATGSMLPEQLRRANATTSPSESLRLVRGTTTMTLIGHTLYLGSYKSPAVGLKIKHAALSQMFHFLFDVLGKNV